MDCCAQNSVLHRSQHATGNCAAAAGGLRLDFSLCATWDHHTHYTIRLAQPSTEFDSKHRISFNRL